VLCLQLFWRNERLLQYSELRLLLHCLQKHIGDLLFCAIWQFEELVGLWILQKLGELSDSFVAAVHQKLRLNNARN